MRRYRPLSGPYLFWALAFVLLPLGMVFYYGFSNGAGAFSLENFQHFFQGRAPQTLWKSVRIAFFTTLLCLLIAYPAAYGMARSSFRKRRVLLLLVVVPMWMNFLLRTYAWITILSREGLLNQLLSLLGLAKTDLLYSESAVILGMVYNFLPFMILPIYTALEKMDRSYLEAAADLGADKKTAFLQITLPLSLGGVASGIAMVFIPAISTFEISSLLGGNKTNLIGNGIEQQFTVTGNWHYGSAMAMVLMVFLLFSLLVGRDKQVSAQTSLGADPAEEEEEEDA